MSNFDGKWLRQQQQQQQDSECGTRATAAVYTKIYLFNATQVEDFTTLTI